MVYLWSIYKYDYVENVFIHPAEAFTLLCFVFREMLGLRIALSFYVTVQLVVLVARKSHLK